MTIPAALKHFLDGMASIFGIYVPPPTIPETGLEDDAKALSGDWNAVGDDIQKAILAAKSENTNPADFDDF